MKRGIYLIWDLAVAGDVEPTHFLDALGGDKPCAIQLRAKAYDEPPAQLASLVAACAKHPIPLVINDRRDWLVAGVWGLHLGQDDGHFAGRDQVVGRSTHDDEQVRIAAADTTVHHLGFGPVRSTQSKADLPSPRGFEALRRAVVLADGKPVVAIGGLGLADIPALRDSGAWAAAVISAVWSEPDPVTACRRLVRAWEGR